MKKRRRAACPRCKRGREVYWYMGLYEFDVDRARELAADGREPIELEDESVRSSVEGSELDRKHVRHVDPSIPGIIAHVRYQTDAGETWDGHVLIDGHHRAARCVELKRPFEVYLLTPEESESILLRSPEDPVPPARAELRMEGGQLLLVDAASSKTLQLDERAFFLLTSADGTRTPRQIRDAYQQRFGKPLAQEEFNVFIKHAQGKGWIQLSTQTPRYERCRT